MTVLCFFHIFNFTLLRQYFVFVKTTGSIKTQLCLTLGKHCLSYLCFGAHCISLYLNFCKSPVSLKSIFQICLRFDFHVSVINTLPASSTKLFLKYEHAVKPWLTEIKEERLVNQGGTALSDIKFFG